MTFAKLLFFIFIPIISFSQKPYDTSTPEKLVDAMANVGQRPADENPIPYLYDEGTATAIITFDEMGEKAGVSFDRFRNNLQEKFPKYVMENKDGKIKISLDDSEETTTRSFSYKVNSITPQIKSRKPTDFKFISATEPDENKISKLTLVMLGEETSFDIKETETGYKMFFTEDILINVNDMSARSKKLYLLFEEANQLLESGKITEENYKSEMERISNVYMEALR